MASKAVTVNGVEDPGFDWPIVVGGVLMLIATSVAAVSVGRRLGHEGGGEEAAGLAMLLMVLNLLQLTSVLMLVIGVFGS